jgi:hypothetical protein
MNRFLLIILGDFSNVDKELYDIASSEGIHYVEGRGLFISTFYSDYELSTIYEKISNRPGFLLFDISNQETYGVNLPTKHLFGLFPELENIIPIVVDEKKETTTKPKPEEYTDINAILDKLSRNGYDRKCLTKKEVKILNSQK